MLKSRRGSSLVFLGFTLIAFILSFAIVWYLVPMVLGSFFSIDMPNLSPVWQQKRDEVEAVTQWVPSLALTLGLAILIIKVLMVASVRGRD